MNATVGAVLGSKSSPFSCGAASPHGLWARLPPNDAKADNDDARQCQCGTDSVAVNSSGRAALEEMAQARVLLAQDGHLRSQGDEFELQGEATTNPEREQRTEGGQKREHADDGMTAAPKILCFLGVLEFCAGRAIAYSQPAQVQFHPNPACPAVLPQGQPLASGSALALSRRP